MEEELKKEILKVVLYILLMLVGGTLAVILTDNSFLLLISGMIIGIIDNIFDKWIDENWRKE